MVKVYRSPKIGVLSTRDELAESTTRNLGCGQIRDCNRAMILAAAVQQSCRVVDLGIARDDEVKLEKIIDKAFAVGVDIIRAQFLIFEATLKKKYGGIVPKKPPLISKDHERAYFDSADWALEKQGVEKLKGPLEALRPKLQIWETDRWPVYFV